MSLKDKILALRSQNKSYGEIQKILGCSKGTICFHCGSGQKLKNAIRTKVNRSKAHPFQSKSQSFSYSKYKIPKKKPQRYKDDKKLYLKIYKFSKRFKGNTNKNYIMIPVQDIINKFSENPVCYLTGELINIYKPKTYEFDHKIPASRGGDNSLNNLGICTKVANQAKKDLTPDEFINLCKQVLEYNGFEVNKK
jgi:5-methylcytosine-specific restriction endonuclease McrA